MSTIIVTFLIALIWLLRLDNDARDRFLAVLGCTANRLRVTDRSGNNVAVALLVFVALVVVVNPEVRLLLLFIDAVGLDVFVLLVFFQLRGSLTWICHSCARVLRDALCNWAPLPFITPTPDTLRRNPLLTVFSASSPIIALAFLVAPLVLGYIGTTILFHMYV